MAGGLDEDVDVHLTTPWNLRGQQGSELHDLCALHSGLYLCNAYLPAHTHSHTQLWGVENDLDKGDTNPRIHRREIQEKPIIVYEEKEPFFPWEKPIQPFFSISFIVLIETF